MSIVKRLLPFLIIILLVIVIKNNISAILSTFNNTNTTQSLNNKLGEAKKENKYLSEQLKYVKTDQFVEEQAQNKLGLLKSGEYFVIAPTTTPLDTNIEVMDQKPNWQKWLELFF